MAAIKAPAFKRSADFCGMAGPVDGVADGQTCKRLVAHHGEHRAFVTGNGVRKPKARKVASRSTKRAVKVAGSRLVTVAGVQYRVSVTSEGLPVITPVTASKAKAKKAAPAVKVLPMAVKASRRRVAAPSKVTKRSRSVTSGKPSSRLA